MLPVVLHPDVVNFLRINTNNQLQEQTWNCIDKLRQQQFSGGLRVKKLQGTTKRVWEARINLATRLIFTYNKSKLPKTGEIKVYITVQDICDHDHINRTVARVRTEDAVWLDGEIIQEIGNIDSNLHELSIDERNQIGYRQLEEEDYNLNFIYEDELLGNIQWQVVESAIEWQQAIIKQDADLPIKITHEEYRLATSTNDILLKGSAGTGKTTVALYRIWHDYKLNPYAGKRLYVAYSSLLVNNVKEQFYKLVGNLHPEINIDHIFQFKTFRNLCLDILKNNDQNYLPEDEVDFQYFEMIYGKTKEVKQYPSALVWDEIRSIIKGSQLAVYQEFFSQDEYERLGRKSSSVVLPEQRSTIYKILSWYQRHLRNLARFDEIDLTRKALKIIIQNQMKDYHLIVCDEVQDFTKLQLEMLMQLMTSTGNLYFAGDLHQMISPSGFRWENLTTIFHEHQRKQPQQHTLKYNFRSVGTLVNFANQILKIRYRLLCQSSPDFSTTVSNYGEKVRIVQASLIDMKSSLKTLHPSDAILVRTDECRENLRQELQSTLIFTIEEAKGLEFDTVFLLDFFQYRAALWDIVLNTPQRLKEKEEPALILELNLLYVAITRARRILNIWENDISAFWQQREVVESWEKQNIETVLENRCGSQQKDWQQRGEYYLQAEFYLQAIECFEKSGDKLKEKLSQAKLKQREGMYAEAALIFRELENWQTAAELFERVKNWQAAANCWQKLGNKEKENICKIHLLEVEGKLQEAAEKWELLARYTEAANLFETLKNWQAAANCWQKAGNSKKRTICDILYLEVQEKWEEAAQKWYQIKRLDDEKRCWMNSNNEVKKAEYRGKDFEKQKEWTLAYEQYILAGMKDKAQEISNKVIEYLMISGGKNMEEKNYQAALLDYNKILEINSNYAPAYFQRGMINQEQKDYMAAIEDYNIAIKINDKYGEAYQYRGKVYQILSHQDMEKARKIKQRKISS